MWLQRIFNVDKMVEANINYYIYQRLCFREVLEYERLPVDDFVSYCQGGY